jgi:hypothetical protein
LINQYGWGKLQGRPLYAVTQGAYGLDLALAVCWAIHGPKCRARDLSDQEMECASQAIDLLEAHWHESVVDFEKRTAGEYPGHISHELRLAALNIEGELAEAMK